VASKSFVIWTVIPIKEVRLKAGRALIFSSAVFVILTLSVTALARGEEQDQPTNIASSDSTPGAIPAGDTQQPQQPPPPEPAAPAVHPGAIVYSPGYETRDKIHKFASFASLPLFAAELYLGEKTYNAPTTDNSYKGAHIAVGTALVGLFGVNTVTGAMNLWEARHDTNGRKLRFAHGILMMAADAGFVATLATTPPGVHNHGVPTPTVDLTNRSLHRDVAIGSISVGTVGYLLMLLAKH
jgi:hypothetical protein